MIIIIYIYIYEILINTTKHEGGGYFKKKSTPLTLKALYTKLILNFMHFMNFLFIEVNGIFFLISIEIY